MSILIHSTRGLGPPNGRSLGPVNPQLWTDRFNRTPTMWPVKVQLFHCPKRVPVAILTAPRSRRSLRKGLR